MTQPAIAGQIHQALDVHCDFAAQVTLYSVAGVDRFTDLKNFLIGKILHPALGSNAQLGGDFGRLGGADAVNILERDHNALVGGDIDPRNTCHWFFLLLHGMTGMPFHLYASNSPNT